MATEESRAILPPTIAGLDLAITVTLGLRRCGHKTRLVERAICGFPVIEVLATPPPRPTRAERGCNLGL